MEREPTNPGEPGVRAEQSTQRAAEEVEATDPFDRGDVESYAVLGED
ncbi:hypothetical protein [Kitasatospora kifunensis]|uniref:Uncharacterized protein n=1 Tax=Kitasatospora kifunensis TaxID=58351 RepID=A0A7W7QX49_KITKI|nr:hypothetical protein [Kitasatospora kifunensis]MBB4921377.1 hypothetical protein [Kitasatospora kifunensis]